MTVWLRGDHINSVTSIVSLSECYKYDGAARHHYSRDPFLSLTDMDEFIRCVGRYKQMTTGKKLLLETFFFCDLEP